MRTTVREKRNTVREKNIALCENYMGGFAYIFRTNAPANVLDQMYKEYQRAAAQGIEYIWANEIYRFNKNYYFEYVYQSSVGDYEELMYNYGATKCYWI